MKTEQQLLDLKKEVEAAKTQSSELTGQQKSLMKQLKDEWACASTEAGDKKITQLLTKLKEIDRQIEENSTKLVDEHNL
jgi:hypothetical protein